MPENASPDESPLIVLVHGAWHGAWCWAALQAELDNRGIPSIAVDLPGHGASMLPFGDLHGDARHVVDVVTRLGRPVVLVGHSYGGGVITEAGHQLLAERRVRLRHLVYLTAFCLDEGESVMQLAQHPSGGPVDLGAAMRPLDNGTSILDREKAGPALYGKCRPAAVEAALERLCPQPFATLTQPVNGAPWKEVPSTYVVCTEDKSIHPGHQQFMSTRCSTVVSLATDHSPFLSMTRETADIIADVLR
jgi:pimeloyl-ACP methyl ester carboxylesterase